MCGLKEGPLETRQIEMILLRYQTSEPKPKSIPFYRGTDHWPDLRDRACKIFQEYVLEHNGGTVNKRVEKLMGCRKTQIYEVIKELGIREER